MDRLPDWLLAGLAILFGLSAWLVIGTAIVNRALRHTAAKRDNLDREEFLAWMSREGVRCEASEFLWDTVLSYLTPHLTPHPLDILGVDLPIDDVDWGTDWPREFTRQYGHDIKALPFWPKGVEVSLLNYGRWLSAGLD